VPDATILPERSGAVVETFTGDWLPPVSASPILLEMNPRSWIPAIVRVRPERTFRFGYRTLDPAPPRDSDVMLTTAVRNAGAELLSRGGSELELLVPWQTLVYGVIRRDVDESVSVTIRRTEQGFDLQVECEPIHSHGAHAAGIGGVLMLAALVWLTVGWVDGIVPGFTTLAAGGLLADVTRVRAFELLERRVRALTADLGEALWPGVAAEIVEGERR
jgi:hypothetical protein